MSIWRCLENAVAEGRLSREKADQALAIYDELQADPANAMHGTAADAEAARRALRHGRKLICRCAPTAMRAGMLFALLIFLARWYKEGVRCAMKVCIFQPSKKPTQSGRAGLKEWVLEYEPETPRAPEPLMGWTQSADTLNQVRLKFATAEDAVTYARQNGWDYTLLPAHARRVVPRNFSDNFKYIPPAQTAGKKTKAP